MKTSIERMEEYTREMDLEDLRDDQKTMDAVIRNLEIIGEAARNIDLNIREDHPGIPWSRIIGLRNIISHAYFGIDWENIWKIIKEDIPRFKDELESIQVEL
jgi:uncharacterized protein with HEPN domain